MESGCFATLNQKSPAGSLGFLCGEWGITSPSYLGSVSLAGYQQINRNTPSVFVFPSIAFPTSSMRFPQKQNPADAGLFLLICGEWGIRTPGTLRHNGFQDHRNRPLCQLSGAKILLFSLIGRTNWTKAIISYRFSLLLLNLVWAPHLNCNTLAYYCLINFPITRLWSFSS